jgi:hypothetical protein
VDPARLAAFPSREIAEGAMAGRRLSFDTITRKLAAL